MSHSPPTDRDESSFRVWVNTPGDFDATSFLEFTLDSISFVLGTAQLASSSPDGSGQCAVISLEGESGRASRNSLEHGFLHTLSTAVLYLSIEYEARVAS